MAQNKSILQQRAEERVRVRDARKNELQRLRENDIEGYVQNISANAVPRTMGASNRTAPKKEKSERPPTKLMQQMASMTDKLNSGQRSEKQKEREGAAKEAREKDIQNKREDKKQIENNRNFTMIAGVYKGQTERVLKALKELGKKNEQQNSSSEESGPSLLDMYEQYQEGKEKEKEEQDVDVDKKKKKKKRGSGQANTNQQRNKRGRGGRRRRPTVGGTPSVDDEFDLEDSDTTPIDLGREERRNQTRQRRTERLRQRRTPGGRGFGRLKTMGSNLMERGSGAVDKVRGSSVVGKLGTGVKVLGGIGAVASAAESLYDAAPKVGTILDSKADTSERVAAGAHLAIQGAGTGIGAILGGPMGAAIGAQVGDVVAEKVAEMGQSLSDEIDLYGAIHDKDGIVNQTKESLKSMMKTITGSEVGKAMGVAAAVAMTPFSEESRKALKEDWEQKILPALDTKFDGIINGLGNYAGALKAAGSNIYNGLKGAGSEAVDGLKQAGKQIADGYNKNGVSGALKAVGGTASTVAQGLGRGYDKAKEGVSSAGAAIRYGVEKGTKNELDLALGFSGSKGIKGFNDSQTKAYAGNVMKTESGGKLGIVNSHGFSGQYQFGADALSDQGIIDKDKLKAAKKAAGKNWYKEKLHTKFMEDESNWKNEGGRKAFLENKTLQDNTFVNYTNKNIESGFRSGALTAKSTPQEIAAYAKAAHLKGTGGANDYFLRGKDSADANGMKVSTYAKGAADSMMNLAARVDGEKAKGALGDPKAKVLAAADKSAPKAVTGSNDSSVAKEVAKAESAKAKAMGAIPVGTKALAAAPKEDLKSKIAQINAPQTSTISAPSASSKEVSHSPIAMTLAPSTTPTAQASAQQMQTVQKGTPAEVQTVHVANQPASAPAQSQTVVAGGGGGRQSTQPSLDDIPMQINDLGLVLLNIGHV